MKNNSPKFTVKGGNVSVSGGNAGPHGKGGDFTMIGGSIKGGDAVVPPDISLQNTEKKWHEKPLGFIVATIFCGLVIAFCAFYFGWTK